MKPWKIQKLFADIVYDLRSRGLLPVAVLLVVGIVAIPFVLASGGSDSDAAPATATPTAAELAPENQPAVASSDPGVRNYKERLDELSSKDPFVQQFAAPDAAATALDQAGVSTDAGTGGATGAEAPSDGGGSAGSGGSAKVTATTKADVRYFYFVTDVAVGEAGQELKKERVKPFDYLPSAEAPVVVFLGNLPDRSAVFLVSKDVTSLDGEGSCFPAVDACQLLSLKAGQSEELVWGVDGKTYRLKVKKIKFKATSKPPSD